jgi:hypothetical protein
VAWDWLKAFKHLAVNHTWLSRLITTFSDDFYRDVIVFYGEPIAPIYNLALLFKGLALMLKRDNEARANEIL